MSSWDKHIERKEKVKFQLTIELTFEECDNLAELASDCHCEAKDIVEAFVSDLTKSSRSNGTNERMYAEEYYECLGWCYGWYDEDEDEDSEE